MSSNSPEFVADPYFNVWPLDLIEDADPTQCITFFIIITAKFTRLRCNSDEDQEGDESLFSGAECEGPSIRFSRTFTQPLNVLTGGEAKDNVAKMLSDVHVPTTLGFVVERILDAGRTMADQRPEHRRLIGMNMVIDGFVEELPLPSEDDDYVEDDGESDNGDSAMEIDDDSDGRGNDEDDYVVRFVRASKQSIEGLHKFRVEVSETSETNCPICFDDFSVDSEAIRLPCSHTYHGDCIVKWLQNSKFCPLCRLEISI